MKIEKLSDQLGAVVSEIDISAPLEQEYQDELQRALIDYGLLLFRGKTLNPDEQINFSKVFGELEKFPWSFSQLHDYPEIFRLSNNPDYGYENVGMYWHSDGSFKHKPTSISIFHPIAVPATGGDTWFSNLHRTLDSMPSQLRDKISSLNTAHRNHIVHPLVMTHPASGENHVYLNVGLTSGILGLDQREGSHLIETVDSYLSAEENHYEHKWQAGDLIVADNFAVAHQARPVLDDELRILHRTTVSNEGAFWQHSN